MSALTLLDMNYTDCKFWQFDFSRWLQVAAC